MNTQEAAAVRSGDILLYNGHRVQVQSVKTGLIAGPHFRVTCQEPGCRNPEHDPIISGDLTSHRLLSV